MGLTDKLTRLASAKGDICVTISLNTHRTRPGYGFDKVMLRILSTEAKETVTAKYGKRRSAKVLDRLSRVEDEIDVSRNLESLHIFISDNLTEIVRLAWQTVENRVVVGDSFDIRTLIKAAVRTEHYLIMVLSQGRVNLYEAANDAITGEIKEYWFPFEIKSLHGLNSKRKSDSKLVDDHLREYFNTIDKSLLKICRQRDMRCVVISTEDNYAKLLQVADDPRIYMGWAAIDYNNTKEHQLATQAWVVVQMIQEQRRTEAVAEMKEAVGMANVLTDLTEIYHAASEGRGELLIVREDLSLPVQSEEGKDAGVVDVISHIACQMLANDGRVIFTRQEELLQFGNIALKTRY